MIFKLVKLNNVIKAEFNELLTKYDLTFDQYKVLKCINQNNQKQSNPTATDIIKDLTSDKATISAIIVKLEKKKFIYKTNNPADKRIKYLHLENNIQNICQEILKLEEEIKREILRNLDATEIKELEKIINKI